MQYKEGRLVFYHLGGRYKKIGTGTPGRADLEDVLTIGGTYQYKRIQKRGASKKTERRYLHSDHLGSVNAVTNEQGQVVSRAQYNVWGEQIVQTGSGLKALSTDMGFTGHETLPDSGLVHMNGRVYDPTIARFMSADLYIQAPFNTQSYNRYTYVFNNPLGYTDPTGYQASTNCQNSIDPEQCKGLDRQQYKSCIEKQLKECADKEVEAEKERKREEARAKLQRKLDQARAEQRRVEAQMFAALVAGELIEYAQLGQALAASKIASRHVAKALAVNRVSSGKAKVGSGSGKHAQKGDASQEGNSHEGSSPQEKTGCDRDSCTTIGNRKAGKINLFAKNDLMNYGSAEARKDDPKYLDIWGHGSEVYMNGLTADGKYFDANGQSIKMDAQALAEYIKNSGKWVPGMCIKLRSCNTGNRDRSSNPLAQELSLLLDTTVVAPNWYYRPNVIDSWSVTAKYWPFAPFGGWNHFESGQYVKTTEK